MTFASPAYFWLLLLLLPLVFWYVMLRRHHEPSIRVASTRTSATKIRTLRTSIVHLPFILRCIAYSLVVVVMARPQTSFTITESEREGIDIMLAMDISTSMLAQDLEPNRIEAAKLVANEFIAERPNDNIGLTLFGGEAFTQCPLTTDHAFLLNAFKNVSCDLAAQGIISNGTAIGMGITNAVSRLAESKAKSKVLILLTDGANNTGEISPVTAAEIAKSKGVRIYTIAVGRQGKVRQPVGVLPNGEYYYQVVESDMDPATLKQIANLTGGLYYQADSREQLSTIYKNIDELEKTKLKVQNIDRRYEAYQPIALIAFCVLLLEVLLRITILRRLP